MPQDINNNLWVGLQPWLVGNLVITLGRISLITHLPYRYSDPINLPQNRIPNIPTYTKPQHVVWGQTWGKPHDPNQGLSHHWWKREMETRNEENRERRVGNCHFFVLSQPSQILNELFSMVMLLLVSSFQLVPRILTLRQCQCRRHLKSLATRCLSQNQ